MAEELTARYELDVTAIVPSAQSAHGARLAAMPRVRICESEDLTASAFLTAGLTEASGLALLAQDDLGNFHAALRAQDLKPDLRLVIAIFNTGLGVRIRKFFTDCAVLSESQMAAPALVAEALGEPELAHVRLASRTLYVARREDVGADQIICGLAESIDADAPRLTPPSDPDSRLVLAVADGTPRNPRSRRRRRRLTAPLRQLRALVLTKTGMAFAGLVAVLCAGYALLAARYVPYNALYLTLLDAAGAAVTKPTYSTGEKIAQVMLTFDGMAFLPLVTAAIVGSRLPGARTSIRPVSGHVIVAGLGNVGARVVGQLHDLGIDVVGVDKNPKATGMDLARLLRIPVVIGETHREETLRAAGVATCRAVVSVTDSDIVNLETALNARALAAEPRIVVRLYDDDLSERIQTAIDNTVSQSTSYFAAPSFAAAMLDHQVLRTIAVGRHVLLLAEVPATTGNGLIGKPLADVHVTGILRVIAVRRAADEMADWSPDPGYRIGAGDRLVVLATRAGLSSILRVATVISETSPGK